MGGIPLGPGGWAFAAVLGAYPPRTLYSVLLCATIVVYSATYHILYTTLLLILYL